MKTMRALFPAILLVLISSPALIAQEAPATAVVQEKVQLQPKWLLGKKYIQSMDMDQTMTISFAGQDQTNKTSMAQEMSMTVTPYPKNAKYKQITTVYEKIRLRIEMAGQVIEYDSEKKDAATGPLAALGAMAGAKLTFIVDENDKFVKFENLNEFVAAITGKNPAAGKLLENMFSEDKLKQMINSGMLQAFPKEPVGAGDSWPFGLEVPIPQVGKMMMKGQYTLKNFEAVDENNCAVISCDASMGADFTGAEGAQAAAFKQLGMKIEDGAMSGTFHFDPKIGYARKVDIEQKMKIRMKNPQTGQGILMPVKQKIRITLTGLEDAE
jgi:hypothetical protein